MSPTIPTKQARVAPKPCYDYMIANWMWLPYGWKHQLQHLPMYGSYYLSTRPWLSCLNNFLSPVKSLFHYMGSSMMWNEKIFLTIRVNYNDQMIQEFCRIYNSNKKVTQYKIQWENCGEYSTDLKRTMSGKIWETACKRPRQSRIKEQNGRISQMCCERQFSDLFPLTYSNVLSILIYFPSVIWSSRLSSLLELGKPFNFIMLCYEKWVRQKSYLYRKWARHKIQQKFAKCGVSAFAQRGMRRM